ncbi:MAG: sulfurtransferase TusA family protein [Desulforhopalus sp.]
MPNNKDKQSTWPQKNESGADSADRQRDQHTLPDWQFDDEFDGGEETCGRVIVNLYLYIRDQQPGHKILVISRDPGAPVELPAWCRMTGNELTKIDHPYYLITLKPHLLRS